MAKTKSKKTRAKTKRSKQDKKLFMIFAGLFIILMIVGYFVLGLLFTVFMGVGILIIAGIAKLVDSVKNKPKQKKVVNTILIIILSLGILVMLAGIVFMIYIAISSNPKFDAEKLDSSEPTILYDANGEEFAKLGSEMRDKVTYDELPEVLVDAIIATEDSRFFQHNGFDAPRFLRASIGQVFGNSDAGGASTLSMQVVKNSLTSSIATGLDGVIRKFQDIYLSIFKLEKNYTKEQIIEFYVNNHNLGGNVYGVSQAARVYFNKDVQDLNLAEASIIAGMFQAPNAYRPVEEENLEAVTKRRDTVLYLMERHGYITEEEKEAASSISIESLINYNAAADTSGNSEYQGYIDTVVSEVEEKTGQNPYVVPMKIYTNLDTEKQDGLNRVMNGESYSWINDVIQSGVAVLDSETGKILAIGAGRNKTGVNQFNYATDMVRQPGSTAKPLFDYGPGMEFNNWSTYTLFVDEPYSYTGGKSIQNWDGTFMGTMTLRRALALSRNIPALKAFQQVDNKKIISFVQGLGIEPEIENGKIHEAHSLGAFNGVSPVQLGGAYAAFANGGYYYEPYTVNKVVFRDTNETKEYAPERSKAMSDSTAFMITDVLKDVSVGYIPGVTFAAKTGTTNYDEKTMEDYNLPSDAISDSWIVGYTPDTLISVWYGYEEIDSEYCSHNLPASNQKNQLFIALGKEVFDKNNKQFTVPNSVVEVPIEYGTNPPMLASSSTPSDKIVYEYFKKGTEPTETSGQYAKLDKPSNFKVTYDEDKDRVTLSWSKVSAIGAQDSYGALGYNVYFNDKLLGFVEKNSYTINNPKTPYGTYKVVATYENYSSNQSSAATFVLEDPNEEEETPPSETKYSSSLTVSQTENVTLSQIGGGYDIPNGTDVITVYKNNANVTNQATISYTIVADSGKTINSRRLTEEGTYTITYVVKFETYSNTHKRVITINS